MDYLELLKNIVAKIYNFLDLHHGEEQKEKVLQNVKANTSYRGSTLWILASAIVIASIGLNVNSTAVIIGAMLISPLMGPIIGAGFALGMYDFSLLRRSLKNLFIATSVSLTVAFVYFFISPFKEIQSEILARTSPNIYDVMIAFLGGMVGVIAITRVEKGNPIPGVAIATALMPPLCTAGYALAINNFSFFFGALFLYAINCVFICLATFLIVKFLKYPAVMTPNTRQQKRIKYGISLLIITLILPSFYWAYELLEKKKFQQKLDTYVQVEFIKKGNILVHKDFDINSNPKEITLAFAYRKYSEEEIMDLQDRLNYYEIQNTHLRIIQDNTEKKQMVKNKQAQERNSKFLEQEKNRRLSEQRQIFAEAKALFPKLEDIAISEVYFETHLQDESSPTLLIVYNSTDTLSSEESTKMLNWIKSRVKKNKIIIQKIK